MAVCWLSIRLRYKNDFCKRFNLLTASDTSVLNLLVFWNYDTKHHKTSRKQLSFLLTTAYVLWTLQVVQHLHKVPAQLQRCIPSLSRKILNDHHKRDSYGTFRCANAILIYAHLCKHFQFKNNKINNKNSIQIIQNNYLCFWPEKILHQQLLNLTIHAIFLD